MRLREKIAMEIHNEWEIDDRECDICLAQADTTISLVIQELRERSKDILVIPSWEEVGGRTPEGDETLGSWLEGMGRSL